MSSIRCATTTDALQPFSIPMRGNELAWWRANIGIGAGFSIPMRGNEKSYGVLQNLIVTRFRSP